MKALYHPLHSGNQSRYGFILFWLLALMLFSLAGCGNSSSDAPTPSGTALIGADGGEVSSPEGVQIFVSQNALADETTIRISKDSIGAPELPESAELASPIFALSPHGINFDRPARLRIPFDAAGLSDPDVLPVLLKAEPGGKWVVQTDIESDGASLLVDANTFSFYVVQYCRPHGTYCYTDSYEMQMDLVNPAPTAVASSRGTQMLPFMATITEPRYIDLSLRYDAPFIRGGMTYSLSLSNRNGTREASSGTLPRSPALLRVPITEADNGVKTILLEVANVCDGSGDCGGGYDLHGTYVKPKPFRASANMALINVSIPPGTPAAGLVPVASEEPQDISVTATTEHALFAVATNEPQVHHYWEESRDGGFTWSEVGSWPIKTERGPVGCVTDFLSATYGGHPLCTDIRVLADPAQRTSLDAAADFSRTVSPSMNGWLYRARLVNPYGTSYSRAARLTVQPTEAPAFSQQPQNQQVLEGETASFTVVAPAAPAATLAWQSRANSTLSWTPISGATGTTYTTGPLPLAANGIQYRAVASNSAGSVESDVATVSVTHDPVAPSISTQPASLSVQAGSTAMFAVAINGTAPLSYQWLLNGAAIQGANAPVLRLDEVTEAQSGTRYTLEISNSAGNVSSSDATLTVTPNIGVIAVVAPSIVTQPVAVDTVEGATATFSVTASGSNLLYQWTRDSVAIPGAVDSSYTTQVLTVADNGAVYGVVVYNGAGVVISSNAVLTCLSVPAWQGATLIEIGTGNLPIVPRMTMNPNGDGFAIWVQNGSGSYPDVWSDRYVADTGWESATMMEASDTNVGEPSIAIEASGNAMAVWPQTDGLRTSIWASRYVVGSGWATPALIETDNAGDAYSPNIAFDPSGNAIAVWHQSDGTRLNVWSNRYVAGTGWGTAALIENNDLGGASHPKVATDANGNAIAVWSQYDGTTRIDAWTNRYVVGTGWGTPELLDTENLGSVGFPTIAMDASGNAFAVWGQWDGSRNNVWANRYVVGTGWGTAALLETDDAGDATPGPVVMDANGNAMVAWNQSDGTNLNAWARRYVAGTGWDTAALLETDNSGDVGIPSIAMNASGAAVAVWHQSDGTLNSIWASHYAAASGWGTPLLLETNDATDAIYPGVVMSASGSAIASWVQGNGAGDNNLWANVFK